MTYFSNKSPGILRKSNSGYRYFVPANLKTIAKAIVFTPAMLKQIQDAALAMGEFSSLIKRLPNTELFMRAFASNEAVQSSRIEGTQTTIADAYKDENAVALDKRDDWSELNAYINAMDAAVTQLNSLPLCNRLLKQTHQILMSQVRGQHKQPGEFRQSQNWIGGSSPSNAHFVPPSQEYVVELMANLEKFIQNESGHFSELVVAALIHYQFESIHPFLDGNGRLGRMLISLYLLKRKVLTQPILYISKYLEKHRQNYYRALDKARESEHGLNQWVSFFLDAVAYTAKDGISVTQAILASQEQLNIKIIDSLGGRAKKGHQLLQYLYQQPFINAKNIQLQLNCSAPVSQKLLNDFSHLGILKEYTGFKRNREFVFEDFFEILSQP